MPSPLTSKPSPPSTIPMKCRRARTCAPAKSTPRSSFPQQYSRRVYAQDAPKLGIVVDNSDLFTSSTLEAEMQSLVDAINAPQIQDRLSKSIALEIVELYPYVNYLKYLLPMTVALAMYISVMIGGGMLYIDDKARGVHEGYLVTPITKLELVFGLNIAGAIKATLSGISIAVIGSLIAGLGVVFHPMIMMQMLCLIIAGSIAFNGMMFLLMVRVDDPLVPRAMFGVLNVLLFYPSGAMYPTASFPKWMQAMCRCRSFHLRDSWLQGRSSQRWRMGCHQGRSRVPDLLRNRLFADCDAAVQADALEGQGTGIRDRRTGIRRQKQNWCLGAAAVDSGAAFDFLGGITGRVVGQPAGQHPLEELRRRVGRRCRPAW